MTPHALAVLFLFASADDAHFEKAVRPLLLARCVPCHGPEKASGRLRLDTPAGAARAVVAGKPDDSPLIKAVRHDGDLKMPPKGRLKDQEVAALVRWVRDGAKWPGGTPPPPVPTPKAAPVLEPDAPSLKKHLQAWYRADTLPLTDGKPVHVWPDSSGNGRDLSATAGVRPGGLGTSPAFVSRGEVNGRPAVRFTPGNGLASSPALPVAIKGDAGFSIVLVANLRPSPAHTHNAVLGFGDPGNPTGDPGRPLAGLVELHAPSATLKLAGGWGHDAALAPGSFKALDGRPLLLTVVKKPGPMGTSTTIHTDGVPAGKVGGKDTVPDIRHRADIGLFMGRALAWSGGFQGDVSEAAVFNVALDDAQRAAVEAALVGRHGILTASALAPAKATFTTDQKAFWAFQPVKPATPPARLLARGDSPAIDRRTLIRRMTFGLTGLPPTPDEVEAFVNDRRPDAHERLVDRLLASPAYGERWGRHWLDVARYAETTANDSNAVLRYAWRYRDYVAAAFNADKPYTDFVIEQIAGDLLPRTDSGRVIATGFLMVGPKALAEADIEGARMDIIDDQIDTIGRGLMGLTVSCARCHDHKFDPIPAADYYSLAGILRGAEVFRDEARGQVMWQEWPLDIPGGKPITVMAPKEGRPTTLRVALRGDRRTPGVLAPRRFLQIIAGEGHAPITSAQSGRLELARWIASAENPLTARVMVNRIWQHHFGAGLVATPDNFGVRGARPTHPELLDWLAGEFVRSGWSVKALHRLILLSPAYRQNRPPRRLDAEALRDAMLAVSGRLDRAIGGGESGEFLFKEGEVINAKRDFFRPNQVKGDHPLYTESTRRSLYLPVVRNAIPDVFTLFDGADPNAVAAARDDTTSAAQALFLLNHPLVRGQALHFARRLLAGAADDAARVALGYRLALGRAPAKEEPAEALAFLSAYQRLAAAKGRKPDEARLAAWQSFCQTLLCRNEFLYVE